MLLHGNARLTPFQRRLVCERVRFEGWTIEEAADAAGCSQRTVYRWLARHDAGEPMTDRSSAPQRRPARISARVEREIERLRRLRWTSTKSQANFIASSHRGGSRDVAPGPYGTRVKRPWPPSERKETVR